MKHAALRRELVETARSINTLGINQGTSGNLSVRVEGGFLITPSGLPYDECTVDDIVEMDMDGCYSSVRLPSTEWRFHRDIYARRPEVRAIVHTHSNFATTLACLRRNIPAFHYMVAVAGGKDIRCAPYATFGTQELSDAAVTALQDRRACLLANHGMVCVEDNLKRALALAVEVETLAEQYWRALQIGAPYLIDDAEMDLILERIKTYGRIRPITPAAGDGD
jgi:L-fuculose-phosphate aldolase